MDWVSGDKWSREGDERGKKRRLRMWNSSSKAKVSPDVKANDVFILPSLKKYFVFRWHL